MNDFLPNATNHGDDFTFLDIALDLLSNEHHHNKSRMELKTCKIYLTLSLNESSSKGPSLGRRSTLSTPIRNGGGGGNRNRTSMEVYTVGSYSFKLPSNFSTLNQCTTESGSSQSFEIISKKDASLEYDIFNIMIIQQENLHNSTRDGGIVQLKKEIDEESSTVFKTISNSLDIQSSISNECLSDRAVIDKWIFTMKDDSIDSMQVFVAVASFRIDPRESDNTMCILEYRKRMNNCSNNLSNLGFKIENQLIEIINSAFPAALQ